MLAGELVANGKYPYRDFFYPQAPLLPFLWGLLNRLGLHGFLVGRAIMGVCAALATFLVVRTVKKNTGSLVAASASGIVVCLHELGWQWMPAIKAYGPATLFSVGAIMLVTGSRIPSIWAASLSGALVMASVGCRLLMAPLVVIVPLAIATSRSSTTDASTCRARVLATGAAIASMAAVALAMYVLWARPCWDAFVFNNLGYHARRAAGGLIGQWGAKKTMLLAVLGLRPDGSGAGAGRQFLMLWVASFLGLVLGKRRHLTGTWTLAAAGLFLADFMPNPVHQQYFANVVPLLAIPAAISIYDIALRFRSAPLVQPLAALATMACYVALFVPAWQAKFLRGVYGAWDMKAFRPREIQRMADHVKAISRSYPGPVLAFWPGSLVGVPKAAMAGFENQFGRGIAGQLTVEERRLYKISSNEDAFAAIRTRVPSVVVVDREAPRPLLLPVLAAAGYQMIDDVPPSGSIFVRAKAR
ncbi:MAG: hypothetical protein H7X95_01895 [Deltaproteobacteria bacterium]|nr:hypothetical protein [Deltaproteobacteria bacterium]